MDTSTRVAGLSLGKCAQIISGLVGRTSVRQGVTHKFCNVGDVDRRAMGVRDCGTMCMSRLDHIEARSRAYNYVFLIPIVGVMAANSVLIPKTASKASAWWPVITCGLFVSRGLSRRGRGHPGCLVSTTGVNKRIANELRDGIDILCRGVIV